VLTVAIAVTNPKRLFLTFPTAESILNYRANSVREKIASKSLKAFNGGGRTVGKKEGLIVNKVGDGTPVANDGGFFVVE
jgi:hypothetical protein